MPTTTAEETRSAPRPLAPRGADQIVSAAIAAIAYADVFDWPLTATEVHRFLPVPARPDEVAAALAASQRSGAVAPAGGLYVLPGRQALAGSRRRREMTAARLWPSAVRSCRVLASLPWVRLVAVSGSLAVGAAEDDADVDLFIVTVDGRVWLARALTIALGKAAARARRRQDIWLCPNYLLTATALELPERDVFTAHELAQLVPLFGPDAYRALLTANPWYRDFLPNHPGYPGPIADLRGPRARRAMEPILGNRLVSRLERWEMERKIARLGARSASAEVRFDATTCKGHFGGYRRRTLESLGATMARLEGLAS
ncbi:MAG TPA: hypothetical protein VIX82_12140 [Solirubrobacteraceae bacterium]